MCGVIPPLPNTLSWRGAQLKHRGTFTCSINVKLIKVAIGWTRNLVRRNKKQYTILVKKSFKIDHSEDREKEVGIVKVAS
jgi:hypothetical protein